MLSVIRGEHFNPAKLGLLISLTLFVLQSCAGNERTQSNLGTSALPTSSHQPISSSALPRPTNCESWVKGTDPKTQLNQAMPDSYIKRIAQGQGLPPEFYASGIVPKNFCKPVNGVWTFPQGDQHFYNADEATVLAHNIPPNDRQTILTLANKIPAGERFYIKWMYTRDGLIVFSMKPENRGIFVGGGTPYFALNKGEIVNPDDGEVGPPPPRV